MRSIVQHLNPILTFRFISVLRFCTDAINRSSYVSQSTFLSQFTTNQPPINHQSTTLHGFHNILHRFFEKVRFGTPISRCEKRGFYKTAGQRVMPINCVQQIGLASSQFMEIDPKTVPFRKNDAVLASFRATWVNTEGFGSRKLSSGYRVAIEWLSSGYRVQQSSKRSEGCPSSCSSPHAFALLPLLDAA